MIVLRNIDVISSSLNSYSKAAELSWNNTELIIGYILNCNLAAGHGGEPYKAANLNHIREDGMLCSAQRLNTLNHETICAYSGNFSTHSHKHFAKLLKVWFASCIINNCSPLCKNSSHYNICSTGYRSLIKKHICTFKTILCSNLKI